jgi:hypothetical protein
MASRAIIADPCSAALSWMTYVAGDFAEPLLLKR